MTCDPTRALIADMRASFDRLEPMVADLHPTDEADPAKAELIAGLKRELDSLRGGLEQLEGTVDEVARAEPAVDSPVCPPSPHSAGSASRSVLPWVRLSAFCGRAAPDLASG